MKPKRKKKFDYVDPDECSYRDTVGKPHIITHTIIKKPK